MQRLLSGYRSAGFDACESIDQYHACNVLIPAQMERVVGHGSDMFDCLHISSALRNTILNAMRWHGPYGMHLHLHNVSSYVD